ncbi:MAG: tRNA (adenosine(37)-N6)-dimethylallyltransferase MiaA [Clostridia bacterium]|nr:tRNA (adenosine(37)-N6)-dimethylallyltransferase MiaA [Clostridia bacterium]
MAECKIQVAAVVGPTASGKTALSVNLCRALDGEVVSCDSMQIYKDMDIATAKPTPAEMGGIPHHLIGFVDTSEEFSVARYCEEAKKAIISIHARGKMPVVVGGTGLYYSSLVDNIDFFHEENDYVYREELKKEATEKGAQVLLDRLAEIDPVGAEKLHVNDLNRIIRALEKYQVTGMTKTQSDEKSRGQPSPFEFRSICLSARDRQVLYDRINRRVDGMIEAGLVEEARRFFALPAGNTAVQAIGYKELKPFIDGEKSLDECIETLKMQTRRYAKRQLTWFRRDERIKVIYIDDYSSVEEMTDAALEYLRNGGEHI